MNDIMGVDRDAYKKREREREWVGCERGRTSASSLWIFVLCTSSTATITNDASSRLSHIVNIVVNTCEREG